MHGTAIKVMVPKIPFLAMTEKKYADTCCKIKVLLTGSLWRCYEI